jgi:methylmalonyl-CoA/ethylmalonyl-CoA epimerase
MIKKMDHLGIAVHSIATARCFYEEVLGLVCEKVEEVDSQQVKIAIFAIGETRIELLEPTGPDSPVARFLEKKGEGLHHVAYATDDIDGQLELAEKSGCQLIHNKPIEGADGKLAAFLHPKSTHGVLTELCSTGNVSKAGNRD